MSHSNNATCYRRITCLRSIYFVVSFEWVMQIPFHRARVFPGWASTPYINTRCCGLLVTFVLSLFCQQNSLLPHPIRPLQYFMRAVMTTSRPQIAPNSEPFALIFAVQGRAVFHQRSSGRWQPEAIAAGMSSSSMI